MPEMLGLADVSHDYEVQVGGHGGNSQRFVALVDLADAGAVSAYRWSIRGEGYAVRTTQVGGVRLDVYMHRELLGLTPGDGHHVDHISGDKLDNRRANLRVCTHAQNCQNRLDRPYRGAFWDAQANRWRACVKLAGKRHYLGCFATQGEAAAAAAAFRSQHMPFSADALRATHGDLQA